MSNIRTATALVILAVIVTGISMANKPNDGEDDSITVSPSMLVLSRYVADVTVHTNLTGSRIVEDVVLYRTKNGKRISDLIRPCDTFTDAMNHLVAKFNAEDVKDIVEIGKVELTLEVTDEFIASDKIRVKR